MQKIPQFDPTRKFSTVRGKPGVGYLQAGHWFSPQRFFVSTTEAAPVPSNVATDKQVPPPPPPPEEIVAKVPPPPL